jgi:hypothetical protein
MVSDLNLFAISSGYVCADVMLASRDGWEGGSDVVRLNDESHMLFDRRDLKSAPAETL